jgi:hypothetical protein
MNPVYTPQRIASSQQVPVRNLSYHCLVWGDPAHATPERPVLIATHGSWSMRWPSWKATSAV